ncbi:MAG: DNA polymerase I [Candidatus Omnitrophica bacterium]|nr:DNA polymerase I [Candidatus Omnitrophota bacterium]
MQRKKLFLVDGNSYIYRAYYAIGELTTSTGIPTGAVFGFVTMLNRLKAEAAPDYLAVCFDLKGPTLRHGGEVDYKKDRKPMPEDLISQMQVVKEVIGAYGIPIFQLSGYEADDIIATLAVKFKNEVDVYIASSDKDMLQLVDNYVKIYNPQKEKKIVDHDQVFEKFKVTPSQITDLLALAGDSSDSIPGVPGIGPKTAAELLSEFKDLEGILNNTDKITQKKRKQLLEEFADQARLSKKLATVITDAPIDVSLERLKGTAPDTQNLRNIFQKLEFKNLYRNLVDQVPKENIGLNTQQINSNEELYNLSLELKKEKTFSFCVRTDNENPDNIKSIEISTDRQSLVRIILNSQLTILDIKRQLEEIFSNLNTLKISYDIKSLCVIFAKNNIVLDGPFFDIMVGAYLLEPGASRRTLGDIAGDYIARNIDYDIQAIEQINIKDVLEQELETKELIELFNTVEMPLIRVLAVMECAGIKIDKDLLCSMDKSIENKLELLTAQIYKTSGCEFNINSPKQLGDILFDKLNLTVGKKGKSGFSTNGEVLKQLSLEHELPAMILEYRELAKLRSTYVLGLLDLIVPLTSRIHTTFNQTVTATGRLSSSTPNLQNIPVRTDIGRKIRAAFISKAADWSLLSADYSQIELRVLAHLSEDEHLIRAFNQDLDIHTFTATLIFDIPSEKVDTKMRYLAKRVNFGIIYGMGAYGLARDIDVSHAEAKKFIQEYFKRYPSVQEYLQKQIDQARQSGYVTTLLNRRRYIPQINTKNAMQRSFAERTAMNTPIQGTAADLIKVAMINVLDQLNQGKLKSVMLLQVHDELVFDVPDDELEQVKKIVKQCMESVFKLKVPIKVDLKSGKNWRDMQ